MRKLDNQVIIWPVYFDVNRSREEGRRVPKAQAVQSPKITEIQEAATKMGLAYEINLEAHHPKYHWAKTGMLIVEKREAKEVLLKKFAKQLIKIKNQQQSQQPTKR